MSTANSVPCVPSEIPTWILTFRTAESSFPSSPLAHRGRRSNLAPSRQRPPREAASWLREDTRVQSIRETGGRDLDATTRDIITRGDVNPGARAARTLLTTGVCHPRCPLRIVHRPRSKVEGLRIEDEQKTVPENDARAWASARATETASSSLRYLPVMGRAPQRRLVALLANGNVS